MKPSLLAFRRQPWRAYGCPALLMTVALTLSTFQAQAVINADRTRIIMNSSDQVISIGLENTSKDTPFLAQSWMDDSDKSRSKTLIVLPPLQRMDGKQKAQVRIMQIKTETDKLPQDRETLFYFNVLGVPPKAGKSNVVQLAQQSRLKLFYRPPALEVKKDNPERKLIVLYNSKGLTLKNPTGWNVSLVALGTELGKNLGNFNSATVAPFSEMALPGLTFSGNHLYVGYVDDYGGLKLNHYHCDASQCVYVAAPDKKGKP